MNQNFDIFCCRKLNVMLSDSMKISGFINSDTSICIWKIKLFKQNETYKKYRHQIQQTCDSFEQTQKNITFTRQNFIKKLDFLKFKSTNTRHPQMHLNGCFNRHNKNKWLTSTSTLAIRPERNSDIAKCTLLFAQPKNVSES